MLVELEKEVWSSSRPSVSVVIPFLDEEETVNILHERVASILKAEGVSYEIIFVDDGSRDRGPAKVRLLAGEHDNVSLLRFRRNYGKAAALSAGFREAAGDIIITMDADLQDDPAELPRFIEKINDGADLVCGWKQVRLDPIDKTWPSKLFNAAVNRTFGLKLQDHNCGFKAYRREVAKDINLYGELHRFVPALAHAHGFQIVELPVAHHPRRHGKSKYGVERLVKGAFDLLTVSLTTRFRSRPLHLFGASGLLLGGLGFLVLAYLTVQWIMGIPIGDRPLLLFGILMTIAGGQLISTGLIAELIIARTISEPDKYHVAECVRGSERRLAAV